MYMYVIQHTVENAGGNDTVLISVCRLLLAVLCA